MRLKIMSDIHTEFFKSGVCPFDHNELDESTTLILAGDISQNIEQIRYFSERYAEVIFVPGNHEFYGEDILTKPKELKEEYEELDNVYVLLDEVLYLEGVSFFGGTFWTDCTDNDPLFEFKVKRSHNDYRKILKGDLIFTPSYQTELHHKSLSSLMRYAGRVDVVITHHAPSVKSVEPRFLGTDLNKCFANDHIEDLVEHVGAKYWIHGHLHNSSDYFIGDTRVICNPKGYPMMENEDFNENLIVEV